MLKVMEMCFKYQPEMRPTFEKICQLLTEPETSSSVNVNNAPQTNPYNNV